MATNPVCPQLLGEQRPLKPTKHCSPFSTPGICQLRSLCRLVPQAAGLDSHSDSLVSPCSKHQVAMGVANGKGSGGKAGDMRAPGSYHLLSQNL